ncbi:8-amino-7-oxononanoate synthase [Thalassotalea insulae]|uniref:8-amino-7-oxononanoate synthase n=1 Tax=Thalassotalea insulae TaxID=2056778 RepID=A0ABQ6GP16_9GAMM|nr:aminotransferase class I/II-fold pyridoxal phosphate-dependent enzyme [Thalassotalea insulae]GLX77745.1 8-amino-7-oxononanoate synthase [Thalassotalea insulae]
MDIKEELKSDITVHKSLSIDKLVSNEWDSIVPRATGLKYDVLSTFEKSKVNNLICSYLTFKHNDKLLGKANLYEVSMDFTSMDKNLSDNARKLIKDWYPDFLNLSMIECGLFAMNGDGLVVSNEADLPNVIAKTAEDIEAVAIEKSLDLCVFRDVKINDYHHYEQVLLPLGYLPCAGFTNAVLDIEWESLDDYLLSRKSKTRHKLKNTLTIEKDFNLTIEITSQYSHLAKEMATLWSNVNASSSDYNREQLDEQFFYESGQRLNESSEAILFFHNKKLVAFMWNLIGSEDYHMADWGVDYSFEKYREANFYRAASVLSVKRAIELNKRRMQLGMTNYVPKKLLGAKMQPLIYFIKHTKNSDFTSVVTRMITDAIDHPEELNYYPKTPNWPDTMSVDTYKQLINSKSYLYNEQDVLHSVESNYEIDILKVGGLYSFYSDINDTDIDLARSNFFRCADVGQTTDIIVKTLSDGTKNTSNAPMFSGVSNSIKSLQERFALLLNKEQSQIFPSATSIHQSVLGAILNNDSLIFIDDACHPGLWQAAQQSGAEVISYSHNDVNSLEALISQHEDRNALVVSESIFSLLGNSADLEALVSLKQQHKFRLYIDESQAFGIIGEQGAGLAEFLNVSQDIDIITASCIPGFDIDCGIVWGTKKCIDYIKHASLDLIFSAGVSDIDSALLNYAQDNISTVIAKRTSFYHRINEFVNTLEQQNFSVIYHDTSVVTIVLSDFMLALTIQRKLLDQSIKTIVVGPPSVPEEMTLLNLRFHEDINESHLNHLRQAFSGISTAIYE